MADVEEWGRRSTRSTERGQLFVVGAVAMATLLVALSLFLNSAIYAQNLAARNADPGIYGADEHRQASVEATAGVMQRVNYQDVENNTYPQLRYGPSGDEDDPNGGVSSIGRYSGASSNYGPWANASAAHRAYGGSVSNSYNLYAEGFNEGALIRQNTTGELTSQAGNTSWNVTSQAAVGNTRAFRLELDPTSMDNTTLLFNDPVILRICDGFCSGPPDDYRITISKPSLAPTNLRVEVEGPAGTHTDVYGAGADGVVRIDIGNASIEGEHVGALVVPPSGLPSFDPERIEIEDGDEIEGTYQLIAQKGFGASYSSAAGADMLNPDGIGPDEYHDATDGGYAGGEPWATKAIYRTQMEISYHSSRIDYDGTINVAPEVAPEDD